LILLSLDLQTVFLNLLELFLLIGAGYGVVRSGALPASASSAFSGLLMNVTLPATILTSLVRPYDPAFIRDGVLTAVLGAVLILGYGLFCIPALCLFRVPEERRGIWILCCTFCNNGFMGFPITLALFGEEGLALAVFLAIPFNLLIYTAGPWLVCLDRPSSGDAQPSSWRAILFTATNLATLLGILLYALRIPLPAVIVSPLGYLSDITTPLSMVVIGMNLVGQRVSAILRDRDVLSASLLRLLVLPVLTWALLELLPISNPLVVGVIVVIMAMPCAAVTSILAESYGGNTEFPSKSVFLSSLFCLVTIPLISLLL
jgi:putative auxin efflux carrier